MCLAIPGQIIERSPDHPDLATVEVSRVRRLINVALLADEPLVAGDWVLIHVGFAMGRVSESAAREQLRLLAMLGEDEEAMRELESLPESPELPETS